MVRDLPLPPLDDDDDDIPSKPITNGPQVGPPLPPRGRTLCRLHSPGFLEIPQISASDCVLMC